MTTSVPYFAPSPKLKSSTYEPSWGERRGRNPKRWNILYDERIVPDNFEVGQILPPGKHEVVLLMQRKKRK